MKFLGLNSPEIFLISVIFLSILGTKRIEKGLLLFQKLLKYLLRNDYDITLENTNLKESEIKAEEVKTEEVKEEILEAEIKAEEAKTDKIKAEVLKADTKRKKIKKLNKK